MKIKIIDSPLELTLFGAAKTHEPGKSYSEELVALLNGVWESVKSHNFSTTGINYAVYGEQMEVFAGVVITERAEIPDGLTAREIVLKRYAYYKHMGPYVGLPRAHQKMREEIQRQGLVQKAPLIEIYGHWSEDPLKLETELLYALA